MFECIELREKEDYFRGFSARNKRGVYFCRLAGFNDEVREFLVRYAEEARKHGVWIREKIQNPTEQQLSYFEEIIGLDFRVEAGFFDIVLKKWLPRLTEAQRQSIVHAMCGVLEELKRSGKNENILKNGYIKFMCWFYYKFERILNLLGSDRVPKLLYEGSISTYELYAVRIMAHAGCDVLLVEYDGDAAYSGLDSASAHSQLLSLPQTGAFPEGFSILSMLKKRDEAAATPQIKLEEPQTPVSTNTWLTGDLLEDCLRDQKARGAGPCYFNMFVRMRGAEDKSVYESELLKWKLKVEGQRRILVLLEKVILVPGVDETKKIARKNYPSAQMLIGDLASYIHFPASKELTVLAKKSFSEVMTEESLKKEMNPARLSNRAICLLCWVLRYVPQLFPDWNAERTPVFALYGACSNENESALLRFLRRMPVDVLEICPDLSIPCKLEDTFLFDRVWENSLPLGKFPTEADSIPMRTVAYSAEQELNTVLYDGQTGLYRNRQFQKAIPVTLHTTYEEIAILWDQEAKYRPNFEVLTDRVMVPVICAKVSGVPGSDPYKYWQSISALVVEETAVIYRLPYITGNDANPIKAHATKFIKNGRLLFDKIKEHQAYQYSFLREEMQDYMLDKLQECLDKGLIEGTFSRGTEYAVIATCLNLNMGFLRMIQKFDFTKKIPKMIVISSDEARATLEDSILVAYLNLLGFDIVIFTPTGYQNVEADFTQPLLVEHQVGDYMYDLQVPNMKNVPKGPQRESLRDILFRRGK